MTKQNPVLSRLSRGISEMSEIPLQSSRQAALRLSAAWVREILIMCLATAPVLDGSGTIYFRGPIQGYSEKDVRLLELAPQDWNGSGQT